MSKEQLDAFLEALKVDSNLQEKLNAAINIEAVEAIAKVAGFSISVEALSQFLGEVSEEELENMAGGKSVGHAGCAGTNLWNCKHN